MKGYMLNPPARNLNSTPLASVARRSSMNGGPVKDNSFPPGRDTPEPVGHSAIILVFRNPSIIKTDRSCPSRLLSPLGARQLMEDPHEFAATCVPGIDPSTPAGPCIAQKLRPALHDAG